MCERVCVGVCVGACVWACVCERVCGHMCGHVCVGVCVGVCVWRCVWACVWACVGVCVCGARVPPSEGRQNACGRWFGFGFGHRAPRGYEAGSLGLFVEERYRRACTVILLFVCVRTRSALGTQAERAQLLEVATLRRRACRFSCHISSSAEKEGSISVIEEFEALQVI